MYYSKYQNQKGGHWYSVATTLSFYCVCRLMQPPPPSDTWWILSAQGSDGSRRPSYATVHWCGQTQRGRWNLTSETCSSCPSLVVHELVSHEQVSQSLSTSVSSFYMGWLLVSIRWFHRCESSQWSQTPWKCQVLLLARRNKTWNPTLHHWTSFLYHNVLLLL